MDIPANKNFPSSAVQCDKCGGHGCNTCGGKGWLPAGHPSGRHCYRDGCENPIPPAQVAVYCSNDCAMLDTYGGRPTLTEAYLVWSNEHKGWWGSNAGGYSPGLLHAGHYTRDQALRICRDALGTAPDLRIISEIPVKLSDVHEFLLGQVVPFSVLHGGR